MKHIILTLSFLLISVLSFGQKKVDLLDFLDELDWKKSETQFLKKYQKLIINETDSIADLHAETGSWYLDNMHVNGIESAETAVKFDERIQSILVTASFYTSIEKGNPFYKSIIDKWGESESHMGISEIERYIPEMSQLKPTNVFVWHNGKDIFKMLVEASVNGTQGYMLLFMTTPGVKEMLQMFEYSPEEIDSLNNLLSSPKIREIDPIFFNVLRFGPDITEKEVLNAITIATHSKREEDVVNHIQKQVSSDNSYAYTVDSPVSYFGVDWEAVMVMSINKKLFNMTFIQTHHQSDSDYYRRADKILNMLRKEYGEPELLQENSNKTYSWKENDKERGVTLSIGSNATLLGYSDFSCKSLEPVNTQKSLQTRFFGNLRLGAPIIEEDVEDVVKNASKLFLNNNHLLPRNYINKNKISWNSMSYVITTPITFAGNQWDFVVLRVEDAKLASIEFQKSNPRYQKLEIDNSFADWKEALIGKYGLYKHILQDNLSSGIYLWTETTSPNYITLENTISTSEGGETRCYLKLIYSNNDLVNKQSNSIQDEF